MMTIRQITLLIGATVAFSQAYGAQQPGKMPHATRTQVPGFTNTGVIENYGNLTVQTPSFVNNGEISNFGHMNIHINPSRNHRYYPQPMQQYAPAYNRKNNTKQVIKITSEGLKYAGQNQKVHQEQLAIGQGYWKKIETEFSHLVYLPDKRRKQFTDLLQCSEAERYSVAPTIYDQWQADLQVKIAVEQEKDAQIGKVYLEKLHNVSALALLPDEKQQELTQISLMPEQQQIRIAQKTYKEWQQNSEVKFAQELNITAEDTFVPRPHKEKTFGGESLVEPSPKLAPWRDMSFGCEQLGLTEKQTPQANWEKIIAII